MFHLSLLQNFTILRPNYLVHKGTCPLNPLCPPFATPLAVMIAMKTMVLRTGPFTRQYSPQIPSFRKRSLTECWTQGDGYPEKDPRYPKTPYMPTKLLQSVLLRRGEIQLTRGVRSSVRQGSSPATVASQPGSTP